MLRESNPRRTPVLLLTGFLGSGKTTLLNRVIAARGAARGAAGGPDRSDSAEASTGSRPGQPFEKIAIVVNEFGEIGIDGSLLPTGTTRQVELPGGCICCVLNEDLDRTLNELLDDVPDVEAIVIETTGIAEPLPISWALEREPLSERIRLAAIVTVVDVTRFEHSRNLGPAVDTQVEYADILVLSKMDVYGSKTPPSSLMVAIRELNPTAPLVSGSPDEVVEVLWRLLADPELPDTTALRRPSASGHDHEHEHGHGQAVTAGHGFDTVWTTISGILDFEELTAQLEELPDNYVRIKGIAQVIDESTGSAEPRWVAFHRVGTRVSCDPLSAPAPMRVVAIGPGVERARLTACVESSVIPSGEVPSRESTEASTAPRVS